MSIQLVTRQTCKTAKTCTVQWARADYQKEQLQIARHCSRLDRTWSCVLVELDSQGPPFAVCAMELFNSSFCSFSAVKLDSTIALQNSSTLYHLPPATCCMLGYFAKATALQLLQPVADHVAPDGDIFAGPHRIAADKATSCRTIAVQAKQQYTYYTQFWIRFSIGVTRLTLLRPSRPYTTSARSMVPHSSNMGRSSFQVYFQGMPWTTTCIAVQVGLCCSRNAIDNSHSILSRGIGGHASK